MPSVDKERTASTGRMQVGDTAAVPKRTNPLARPIAARSDTLSGTLQVEAEGRLPPASSRIMSGELSSRAGSARGTVHTAAAGGTSQDNPLIFSYLGKQSVDVSET